MLRLVVPNNNFAFVLPCTAFGDAHVEGAAWIGSTDKIVLLVVGLCNAVRATVAAEQGTKHFTGLLHGWQDCSNGPIRDRRHRSHFVGVRRRIPIRTRGTQEKDRNPESQFALMSGFQTNRLD